MLARLLFEAREMPHWSGKKHFFLQGGNFLSPMHTIVASMYFNDTKTGKVKVGEHPETVELLVFFLYHLDPEELMRRVCLLRVNAKQVWNEIQVFLGERYETLASQIDALVGFHVDQISPDNGHFAITHSKLLEIRGKVLKYHEKALEIEKLVFDSDPIVPGSTRKSTKRGPRNEIVTSEERRKKKSNAIPPLEVGQWTVGKRDIGSFMLIYKRSLQDGQLTKVPVFVRGRRYSLAVEDIVGLPRPLTLEIRGTPNMTLEGLLKSFGLGVENFVNWEL
jgi:hypothetical protein